MINKEFLRYLDIFGTKCSFYTEQRLKLYTPLGGILSITSFVAGIFIFIYFNMSSFKREDPTIVTSSVVKEEHKIKFSEEKIWIPWKISNDNDDNFFNYSGVLFPIIKYYYKDNNTELNSKNLSFRLCNETSMANKPENYLIESSLDQLYCIDMEDLFMGGEFNSSLYYVQLNLYICKDGIDYDQNNSNCVSNDKLNNFYNYLKIIFYYPSFQFQQINYESPVKIQYFKNYVLLNQNVSKIEQLYLRKIIIYDKLGLFDIKTKIYNYWTFSSIYKDFYFIQNNSISKLYSFDIFIEPNTIYYYRSYKSISFILAQSLPLIKLVHNLLKLIAKVFKLSSINRKMTELLFENLTEKPNKYEHYVEEIKSKKNIRNLNKMNMNMNMNNKSTEENNLINITNKDNFKNNQNFSSYNLFKKTDKNKDNKNIIQLHKKGYDSPIINHKTISINDNNKVNFRINSFNFKNLVIYKKLRLSYKEPVFPKKKRFVANKLFPFRYYFCAIFVKNIDLSKHRFCMSRKFIKVYSFLCQLFDISSYCILQKEFNIVKNTIFDEQKIKLIEQKSKINVNSQSFMREMNDCIGKNKFNILGKNNLKRKSAESPKIEKNIKL